MLLYYLLRETYTSQVSQQQVRSKCCALGCALVRGKRKLKLAQGWRHTWKSLAVHPVQQRPTAPLLTDLKTVKALRLTAKRH